MRVRVLVCAAAAIACAACKGDGKRELGLAGRDGGAPVVVVDQPAEAGAIGPLQPEAEPNDQRDKAAAVPLPGGVAGSLGGADDIDFYRIEAGAARQVVLRLIGPPADDGGADLVLELYDGDGVPLARSDRGPAGALEGLPNASLAQGAVHYVSVSQFVKKGKGKKKAAPAEGKEPSYQLTMDVLAPGPDDEQEPNEAPERAREVLLAEEKSGYLGWGKDQDQWKLSLAGFTGGFALDLSVGAVEGVALAVDILAPDGRVLVARKGQKDRALFVRGLLPELGAKFYLARVSGSRSNPEESYRIRSVSRSLAETDEAEPNDEPDRAVAAGTLGDGATGERRGFLDGGDTDVYKFEAGREALGLSVSVEAPATTDVVLRVLGPGGAEVARADGGKAGQREEIAGLSVGRGEVRFVVVSGTAQGDEADAYLLRWTSAVDLPAAPTAPTAPSAPTERPAEPEEPPVDDPYE